MKQTYILTGYDKSKGKLNTQLKRDLKEIYDVIITYYSANLLTRKYKTFRDFEFDVMSQRSHEHALIIEDEKYIWSVFQVNK